MRTPGQYPVTSKEQAQWMLHRLAPGRGICNLAFALKVDAVVRWWPLQEAIGHVMARHETLRTVFKASGPLVHKRLLTPELAKVPVSTVAGRAEGLPAQITELASRPFDVERGPLVAVHLVVLPGASVVCVALHHIVADAITAQVVMRELTACYDAFAEGQEPAAEYTGTTAVHLEPAVERSVIDYWRRHLAGIDAGALVLAGARPVPARPTFAGDHVDHALSADAVAAVERLRRRVRCTDNIILLACYYLLLAHHGAGPDLVVGVVTNARRGAQADAVGYHINTLPIRVRVDLGVDFETHARATRDAFLTGLEHGSVSFESLQHELPTRAGDWRVPLFRHSFNVRPVELGRMTMAGVDVEVLDAYTSLSRLDLELLGWTRPDGIGLTAIFSTEVHDRADIGGLLRRFDSLLVELDRKWGEPLGNVAAATGDDRVLVEQTNDTARDWPAVGVGELVRRRAAERPAAIAVGSWTYRKLVAAAAGVRDELVRRGIRAGDVVALHAARGPRLAAAVLGVWDAGAAYLPLDPGHPAGRAEAEMDDAGVRVVLTDRELAADCFLRRECIGFADMGDGDPGEAASAHAGLAYVIYTSGSTGRPKGVEIGHRALANVVNHFVDALSVTAGDRVLWLTTFSFDISALELFVPLTAGATVFAADDEVRMDGAALAGLIRSESITVAQATPSTWRHVAGRLGEELTGCRVLCGGELLTAALAEELLVTGCRLFNVYGPTETTIWSTATELRSPVPFHVPIGTPISNTTVHVLDAGGREVLPGVPGELCVAGQGLAEGYRGDPVLTTQRFAEHPVIGRHYRTGDQARRAADGRLEFLGRSDRQVKIRGNRIELGEVEAVLDSHPDVRAAAVFAEPDPAGNLRLVAAVLADADVTANPGDLAERLRAHCGAMLPAAGVPGRFVPVRRLPKTGNDKVDYRRLACVLAETDHGPAPELPADPMLRELVRSWRDVLGDGHLTAHSNFFLSGGHSLLAAELAAMVSARTGRHIEFDAVFAGPTPVQLLAQITGGGTS
jgi:amino acid adenylation domain-containing protein